MTIPYTYLIGWKSLNKFYYGRRTAKNCSPTDFWKSYFTSSPDVKRILIEHGNPDIIQIRKVFSENVSIEQRVELCRRWENKVLKRLGAAKNPKFINKSNGDAKFDASGMVSVIDNDTGKTLHITSNDFIKNPSKYSGVLKGQLIVTIIESGIVTKIPTEEYHKNKHLYKHHSEGIIFVNVISSGERIKITVDEFHSNRHLYKHHCDGTKLSDAVKSQMSNSHKNKPKSDQHKRNISKALTGLIRTPEHIENLNKSRKPAFKSIIVNGILFQSVKAAAEHFDVKHPTISNRLAGRKKLNDKFWEVRYA